MSKRNNILCFRSSLCSGLRASTFHFWVNPDVTAMTMTVWAVYFSSPDVIAMTMANTLTTTTKEISLSPRYACLHKGCASLRKADATIASH